MEEVFRTRDSLLGRDVAIAVLSAGMAGNPDRLARFPREARAVAAAQPSLYSVEHTDGVHFSTMEKAEGQSLDRLPPNPPKSVNDPLPRRPPSQ